MPRPVGKLAFDCRRSMDKDQSNVNSQSTDKNYQSIDADSIDKHPSISKQSIANLGKRKTKISKHVQFAKEGSSSWSDRNNVDKVNVGHLSKNQLKKSENVVRMQRRRKIQK